MVGDFAINITASIALLVAGFIGRQVLNRVRTRATRRLWREAITSGLTIALSAHRDPLSKSGSKASFAEAQTLLSLAPTFSRLGIDYGIVESFISTASRITNRHILLFGGPLSNELAKAALELLAPKVSIEAQQSTVPVMTVGGRRYESEYSDDGKMVVETYGFIVRAQNPFSANHRLTATLVMGLHGLGTAGAAQLLVSEHLVRQLGARLLKAEFVVIVRVRPIGGEYSVQLEDAWTLERP